MAVLSLIFDDFGHVSTLKLNSQRTRGFERGEGCSRSTRGCSAVLVNASSDSQSRNTPASSRCSSRNSPFLFPCSDTQSRSSSDWSSSRAEIAYHPLHEPTMPLNDSHSSRPPNTTTNLTPQQLSQLQQEGRLSAEARASSDIFREHDAERDNARRSTSGSDTNYPSWLPRRPGKPVPGRVSYEGQHGELRSSNETSSSGRPDAANTGSRGRRPWAHKYGRRPAQRAVRILAVPTNHTDPAGLTNRSRSVAFGDAASGEEASAEPSPVTESFSGPEPPRLSGARPRFRARDLHLELARHPSPWNRLLFFLFPVVIFAYIPIQAFLDFNAVFMLMQ